MQGFSLWWLPNVVEPTTFCLAAMETFKRLILTYQARSILRRENMIEPFLVGKLRTKKVVVEQYYLWVASSAAGPYPSLIALRLVILAILCEIHCTYLFKIQCPPSNQPTRCHEARRGKCRMGGTGFRTGTSPFPIVFLCFQKLMRMILLISFDNLLYLCVQNPVPDQQPTDAMP